MSMSLVTPRRFLLVSATLIGLTGAASGQSADRADLFERMSDRIEAREQGLIDLRHDIHRHPELSGSEERTAGLVARHLADLGFDVRSGVGGHGVVGVLEGGRPGPAVAFRADMDAVRSAAEDPVPYRSTVPGVRHICGHDVHTAVGVGLAEAFAAVRENLPGTVVIVFQPAEETGTGARAMLADGVFARVQPDAIFALHAAPFDVGTVATVAGGMMPGRAAVAVTVRGEGDVEGAASAVRAALRGVGTVSTHEAGGFAPPGFIHVEVSDADRQTDGDATVHAQVMTLRADRARAEAAVRAALDALDPADIVLDVDYNAGLMEGVTNDPALVDLANGGLRRLVPEVPVIPLPGAVPTFSEDFGSFQAEVPGAMYFLGVNAPDTGTVGIPHSPGFVADDGAIAVGARAMAAAMLERLSVE